MNRKSNTSGHWRTALSGLISRIHQTIKTDIEGPSARLGEGASRLASEIFMLDYTARNDPDQMVWESFEATVEEATQKIASRPWHTKLVYYLRGPVKRTGFEYEAFNEVQFVLAWLLKFHKTVEDPTVESVLDKIETFPGADADSPPGFNAMRLAWDKAEEERIREEEKKAREEQDRKDAQVAAALGYPDVETWRSAEQVKRLEEQRAETRDRLNHEIGEIIPDLIQNGSVIVEQPGKDGGYYFWYDPNWRRLNDSIRDRMILRGGRAGSSRL